MKVPEMSLARLSRIRAQNVGPAERFASGALAALLLRSGLRRLTAVRLATLGVSVFLARRALTGRCPLLGKAGVTLAPGRGGFLYRAVRFGASTLVERPPADVYAFWRDFRLLTSAIDELSVAVREDGTSLWSFERLGAEPLRWRARLTEDVPGERLAWETVQSSDLRLEATVRFLQGNRPDETLVAVEGVWFTPLSALTTGASVWTRTALRRIKARIEAGEVSVARPVSARMLARAGSLRRSPATALGPAELEPARTADAAAWSTEPVGGPTPSEEIRP